MTTLCPWPAPIWLNLDSYTAFLSSKSWNFMITLLLLRRRWHAEICPLSFTPSFSSMTFLVISLVSSGVSYFPPCTSGKPPPPRMRESFLLYCSTSSIALLISTICFFSFSFSSLRSWISSLPFLFSSSIFVIFAFISFFSLSTASCTILQTALSSMAPPDPFSFLQQPDLSQVFWKVCIGLALLKFSYILWNYQTLD